MKLATVRYQDKVQAGVVKENSFYAFTALDSSLPNDMLSFIEGYETYKGTVKQVMNTAVPTCAVSEATLLAPLPNPKTIRDFVGFEEHAKNAANHFGGAAVGIDIEKTVMVWKKAPGFYFSNTNSIVGHDEPVAMHPHSRMFDFEFEIGFVIGKRGRDISKADAMDYIFGYTVFNDWSARDIQMQEVVLGVGAPLGKGYANGFGPIIVTKDEWDQYLVPNDPERYDIKTTLRLNGEVIKENNLNTIYYTFADMIAWASRDTDIVPGDVFGSGTIGGGCLAERPPETPWLQAGDVIEMEVEGLGTLKSTIL